MLLLTSYTSILNTNFVFNTYPMVFLENKYSKTRTFRLYTVTNL